MLEKVGIEKNLTKFAQNLLIFCFVITFLALLYFLGADIGNVLGDTYYRREGLDELQVLEEISEDKQDYLQ